VWWAVSPLLMQLADFGAQLVQLAVEGLDRDQEEAASTLGAGPWTIFRRVVLPAIAAPLTTGTLLSFARAIGEFGLIKDKIAAMMAETYALESMTYLTTGLVDRNVDDYSVESAICKVYGSEALWRVVNETLQIAAGIGYMQEYPYERMLRDSRINLIFEGTNEILRCFIALSGMQGPGKALADLT